VDSNYDPLIESGHMVLLDDDPAEIIPGIRADVAFGHNRDMMVVRAESQGQTFCMLADLVPTAAHLAPTWVAAFDLYPLECIDSKTKWLTRAVEGDWLCGFGHDLEIAFTRVAREKNRFVERR
jgi:glyoxylase-like metal-dependent hydrolase (beta-lactamase superfamily II)